MDSLLNCLLELPSLQRKEGKALEGGPSQTAATEEPEQEETPNVDEETSEEVAVVEKVAGKAIGKAGDTVPLAQGIHLLHSNLRPRHLQQNISRNQ